MKPKAQDFTTTTTTSQRLCQVHASHRLSRLIAHFLEDLLRLGFGGFKVDPMVIETTKFMGDPQGKIRDLLSLNFSSYWDDPPGE